MSSKVQQKVSHFSVVVVSQLNPVLLCGRGSCKKASCDSWIY